jgi:hypothetical protein
MLVYGYFTIVIASAFQRSNLCNQQIASSQKALLAMTFLFPKSNLDPERLFIPQRFNRIRQRGFQGLRAHGEQGDQ